MERETEMPTVEQIRVLLAGRKQYFDNDYHPSEFVNPVGETEDEMERRTR